VAGHLGLADDSHNTDVGGRYAQALFQLADGAGTLALVESDLNGLKAMQAESVDLRRLIASPAYTAEDKGRALGTVAGAAGFDPLTRKFVGLVAANGRASALPAMIAAFQRLAAARRGTVAAEVVTAAPLTPDQARGVAAALRQALGREAEVTATVDPSLLGGIRVRVGSRLFDASLRSRLDHMKFALKRA